MHQWLILPGFDIANQISIRYPGRVRMDYRINSIRKWNLPQAKDLDYLNFHGQRLGNLTTPSLLSMEEVVTGKIHLATSQFVNQ